MLPELCKKGGIWMKQSWGELPPGTPASQGKGDPGKASGAGQDSKVGNGSPPCCAGMGKKNMAFK